MQAEEEDGKGGWSKVEHVRFLKGLQVFGSNWNHVAYVVKTRDAKDVQTHATSYLGRRKKPRELVRKRSIHDLTLEALREVEGRLGTDEGFAWRVADMPVHLQQQQAPTMTKRKKG
jgi:hypothetical protein